MKKKVLLAMAVIMVLGSVKAMALTDDEVMDMNAATKIEAVEAMNAEIVNDEFTDGKIAADQIEKIRNLKLNERMSNLMNESMAEGSGLGQLSDLVDRVVVQTEVAARNEDAAGVNMLWEEAMELDKEINAIKERRLQPLRIEQQ